MKRFFGLILCLVFSLDLQAQTWPQWRGPQRDGIVTAFKSPKNWPQALKLQWKVAVGAGHASPVLAGNRVYLLTRQDEQEVIAGYDLKSGKQVWRHAYAADYVVDKAGEAHGKWPRATPLLHDGKLYALGVSGRITCLEARTGKLLWKKDALGNNKTDYPLFGFASSPLFVDGAVIIATGSDKQSGLTAFHPVTGAVKWNWRGEYQLPGNGVGYSSPVLMKHGAETHLVMLTDAGLVGLSPQTGTQLWKFPITLAWESVVTPVIHNDYVMTADMKIGLMAIRISRQGNTWEAKQVWQKREFFTHLSSPVAQDGLLYGMSLRNKGQYFCADLATGQPLWQTEGRQGETAVVRVGGNELFVQTDGGELIVARKSREKFDILRRYRVAESATWAEPILFDRHILVKDANSLMLWELN